MELTATSTTTGQFDGFTAATIDAEDMPVAMQLFSGNYTNLVLAVLRELSANAMDAQIEAGVTLPIEVQLPTDDCPELIITDHGVGLDAEGMVNTFGKYVKSSKRNHADPSMSKKLTGGYGIGAKAPFAICDQYIVESVKDEVRTVGLFVMINGVPSHKIVSQTPARGVSNGLTISMTVDTSQHNTWEQEAQGLFSWWPKGSVEVTQRVIEERDRLTGKLTVRPVTIISSLTQVDEMLSTDIIKVIPSTTYRRDGASECLVRMGSVVYAVPSNFVRLPIQDKFVIFAEIGDFEISASREQISHTQENVALMRKLIYDWKKELQARIRKNITEMSSVVQVVDFVTRAASRGALRQLFIAAGLAGLSGYNQIENVLALQGIPSELTFQRTPWAQTHYWNRAELSSVLPVSISLTAHENPNFNSFGNPEQKGLRQRFSTSLNARSVISEMRILHKIRELQEQAEIPVSDPMPVLIDAENLTPAAERKLKLLAKQLNRMLFVVSKKALMIAAIGGVFECEYIQLKNAHANDPQRDALLDQLSDRQTLAFTDADNIPNELIKRAEMHLRAIFSASADRPLEWMTSEQITDTVVMPKKVKTAAAPLKDDDWLELSFAGVGCDLRVTGREGGEEDGLIPGQVTLYDIKRQSHSNANLLVAELRQLRKLLPERPWVITSHSALKGLSRGLPSLPGATIAIITSQTVRANILKATFPDVQFLTLKEYQEKHSDLVVELVSEQALSEGALTRELLDSTDRSNRYSWQKDGHLDRIVRTAQRALTEQKGWTQAQKHALTQLSELPTGGQFTSRHHATMDMVSIANKVRSHQHPLTKKAPLTIELLANNSRPSATLLRLVLDADFRKG